jgi:hypothetical protein
MLEGVVQACTVIAFDCKLRGYIGVLYEAMHSFNYVQPCAVE